MEKYSQHLEIMEKLGTLQQKTTDISADIIEIKELQKVANGRTGKLEGKSLAFTWVICLFMAIVIPLVSYLYVTQTKQLQNQINKLQNK